MALGYYGVSERERVEVEGGESHWDSFTNMCCALRMDEL